MHFSSVTQTAFASASVLSLILAVTLIVQARKTKLHWSCSLAAVVQTSWLITIASFESWQLSNLSYILIAECFHYTAWLFALTKTTDKLCSHCLPKLYKITVYLVCIVALILATVCIGSDFNVNHLEIAIIWQGIIFSIFGLLSVEQLYRNVTSHRLVKVVCLLLAAGFIFDAYLFSQNLVLTYLDADLWQARAAVSMVTSVLLTVAAITLWQPAMQSAKLTLSRPIAFYTTSLTLAGGLLTVLAVGGYYVRLYGGDWGTVIYTLLLVSGLLLLLFVFSSRSMRENLSVLINKHLFSHKYDYRTEWLKLINQLSQPTSQNEIHVRVIQVVAELFKCSGGALWLKRGKVLVPVRQLNMMLDISETFEPDSSPFCAVLKEYEWVFSPQTPNSTLAVNNELLPDWVHSVDDIWLILPLLNETSLVGFMALASPQSSSTLNWEDLDLLKTVGRQIASYLERHEQSELLAESRQFDAFNKLSAFVMHDLKNLIAQQSLLVNNAEKHKDNPAFIDDTINTINNSVTRMNNLLRKLQHNEPEEIKVLNLKETLHESIRRCQKSVPAPTLRQIDEEAQIKSDPDSLTMVFTHIIQNAQDATPRDGYIDIDATKDGNNIMVRIEDNGQGMDAEFIQHRLFKPFETTKSGKGMGIGVYQAREYVHSLGGTISVESSLGEGTTFIITLPLA